MKPKDQENDWQFWVAVVVVCMLLYVGLTVFHRWTELGGSLSIDGLATIGTTLVAAATGFLAILYQIRSSSIQLREQMADQHLASAAETERQKRAVASAILFEIDGTYRFLLRDVRDFLRAVDPANVDLRTLAVKSFAVRFPILDANAGKIGDLSEETVANVVGLYSCLNAYLISLDNFARSHERWLSEPDNRLLEEHTREYLSHVKNTIPSLICTAHETSRELCNILSRKFESPWIAIAAENMDALREEITKMGDGEIFEPES